jgi:hypothetical protein
VGERHRRLPVGRVLYLGWHAPRAFLAKCVRDGPFNLAVSARERRAMERAAHRLPALAPAPRDAPAVFFLTGQRFWYQTVFCAYSLRIEANEPLRIVAIDDGTLTGDQAAVLRRIFPDIEVTAPDAIERRLDAHLPANRYPTLRQRRRVYPHLRKLTDVHVGGAGWKLVLDSDMLFHARPAFLLDWLANPDRPCHMIDIEDAYGYSPALMAELAGTTVPSRLNVGICGLRSDAIDWDRLERWCRVMLEREGNHYLQEQALVAIMMAGLSRAVAPPDLYIVRPSRDEVERPTAALHHYVADAKAWYFRFGWHRVVGDSYRNEDRR